jgi:putative methyltransferase (TIGR04325 family)
MLINYYYSAKIIKREELYDLINNRKTYLNILDFGGSFGSTYFQNYSILKNKNKFNWSIIEQEKIVKCAKKFKLEDNLSFHLSIKNYMKKCKPDIVLFSSVIQYLERPYKIINYLLKKKIKNIFFLKTPFINNKELIKVQIVPKHIYDASYPVRIFDERFFLKLFRDNNYKITSHFIPDEKIGDFFFKNFIFKLNNYNN